mgnify:FL=1
MTSVTFDSPWINWVAIIYESDDIVIAEIDLNADGKHKQPAAYLTDEGNFFIYFNSGTVKFYDLPFTIPLAFAETSSGTCHVCMMKRPENTKKWRFFDKAEKSEGNFS